MAMTISLSSFSAFAPLLEVSRIWSQMTLRLRLVALHVERPKPTLTDRSEAGPKEISNV